MKSTRRKISTMVFGSLLLGAFALVVAPPAMAKHGGGGFGCPRKGIQCPMVYNPVICSNGVTYSNSCVAYVACATGCVETGGGPSF